MSRSKNLPYTGPCEQLYVMANVVKFTPDHQTLQSIQGQMTFLSIGVKSLTLCRHLSRDTHETTRLYRYSNPRPCKFDFLTSPGNYVFFNV